METSVKINESNFTEEFNNEINVLKSYGQEYGYQINNLLEIMKKQMGEIQDGLDELKIDGKDKIYNSLWQMGTILKIISERVNDKLFFNIDNLIFDLENNKYLKTGNK